MSKKEFNFQYKEINETLDRTALVTPGNGLGVILKGVRSREQVILPFKSVGTLTRFHYIFLSSRIIKM